MGDKMEWMDLFAQIKQTIPTVVSAFLTIVPFLIEITATFETKLISKEEKSKQKSMPGDFCVTVVGVVSLVALVLKIPENGGTDRFQIQAAAREWFNKPVLQWECYAIIAVFLSVGFLWHFLVLKLLDSIRNKLIRKIPHLEKMIQSVRDFFKSRKHDSIGDYARTLNKQLELREPYSEYNNIYILKDSYVQVRQLFALLCWFFWTLAGAYALFGEMIDKGKGGGKVVLIALCAIAFYFYEWYHYYNGYTWAEYEKKVLKQQTEMARKNIFTQRDTVRRGYCVFSEVVNHDRNIDVGRGKELVKKITGSGDYRKRCIGKMWADLLNMKPEETDADFMSAAIQLAEHRSVYFATPFYRDAGPYIFPFLSLELLDNKKILVISGASDEGERLKAWFKEGLQSKYGYLEFWDVETMLDGVGTADIGIATMGEIAELATTEFANDFLKNVSVVLLLEPSLFLSFQPIMMPQILAKIRHSQEHITYIVCDMNITGMVDLLSDTLKESFIFVKATAKCIKAEHTVLDVDCVDEKNPFNDMELCCANELWQALNTDNRLTAKIQWFGQQTIPVWDIRWRLGTYDSLPVIQSEAENIFDFLTSRLEFYDTGSWMRREVRASSFVEDNIYNAAELLRQYESRGYKESQTSVFSSDYLMRDFMMTDEGQKGNPVTQIMPRFQNSFGNMAIAIAYGLAMGSISEEGLEWLLEYYDYNVNQPADWELLTDRLNKYYRNLTGNEVTLAVNYKNPGENGKKGRKNLYYVSIAAREAILNWYRRNIEVIGVQDERLISQENILNYMAGGHIYQYFLPKQFLVASGKYYMVEQIGECDGRMEVKLSRTAEFCTIRRYYRQCRHYFIKGGLNHCNQTYPGGKTVKVCMAEADFGVITKGYISSGKFQEWEDTDFIKTEGIPLREYGSKKILLIQIKEEYACVLAVFLKELFFTLFPNCWQLLSVALPENRGLEGRVDSIAVENMDSHIYIIEDSPLDLGLLDTIGIWFVHILDIFGRYADWLQQEEGGCIKWKTRWEKMGESKGVKFDLSEVKKYLEV